MNHDKSRNQLNQFSNDENTSNSSWEQQLGIGNLSNNQSPPLNNPTTNQLSNRPVLGQQPQNQNQTFRYNSVQLNPEEVTVLRSCMRDGFWMLTVPSMLGFVLYKQYNSLLKLKVNMTMPYFFQTCMVYIGTKFLWSAVCMNRIDHKDILKRSRENRQIGNQGNFNEIQRSTSFPPPPTNQTTPYRNAPYLADRQQPQQSNKEFVDDNYDVSSYGNK